LRRYSTAFFEAEAEDVITRHVDKYGSNGSTPLFLYLAHQVGLSHSRGDFPPRRGLTLGKVGAESAYEE
jgi:hypothetical protein